MNYMRKWPNLYLSCTAYAPRYFDPSARAVHEHVGATAVGCSGAATSRGSRCGARSPRRGPSRSTTRRWRSSSAAPPAACSPALEREGAVAVAQPEPCPTNDGPVRHSWDRERWAMARAIGSNVCRGRRSSMVDVTRNTSQPASSSSFCRTRSSSNTRTAFGCGAGNRRTRRRPRDSQARSSIRRRPPTTIGKFDRGSGSPNSPVARSSRASHRLHAVIELRMARSERVEHPRRARSSRRDQLASPSLEHGRTHGARTTASSTKSFTASRRRSPAVSITVRTGDVARMPSTITNSELGRSRLECSTTRARFRRLRRTTRWCSGGWGKRRYSAEALRRAAAPSHESTSTPSSSVFVRVAAGPARYDRVVRLPAMRRPRARSGPDRDRSRLRALARA